MLTILVLPAALVWALGLIVMYVVGRFAGRDRRVTPGHHRHGLDARRLSFRLDRAVPHLADVLAEQHATENRGLARLEEGAAHREHRTRRGSRSRPRDDDLLRLSKVSDMRWLRRRSEQASPEQVKPEESIEVGGDRIVFWKAKSEEVEGEIYGPVWIADANDPDVTLEEHGEWLSYEQAEKFAQKRGLPLEET